MFRIATREKYRFPYKGQISVEDLWDLSPVQLDTVYKTLSASKKNSTADSLIAARTPEDDTLENKLEIVRYIFETKKREADERKEAAAKAERKRHLTEILARKEDAALEGMSADDLRKMIEELG